MDEVAVGKTKASQESGGQANCNYLAQTKAQEAPSCFIKHKTCTDKNMNICVCLKKERVSVCGHYTYSLDRVTALVQFMLKTAEC